MRISRAIVRGICTIGHALDDLVFPDHCLLTREPILGAQPWPLVSQAGVDALDPAPSELDLVLTAQRHHAGDDLWLTHLRALYAVGSDHGIDRVIHAVKYRGHQRLAVHLGTLLTVIVQPDVELIVPIPIHRARRSERGYNQAELIASGLSSASGLPWRPAVLRTVNTPTQTSLSDARRRANVHAAFVHDPLIDIKGLRIAVVDDVFTTGATVNSCAEVLAEAGARRVDAVTVAATV